jgi:hypothetical protein
MRRCPNCGADRTRDQCEACGLTSAAAEVMFRRRLLNLTAVFLLGAMAFLPASHFYPPLELDAVLIFIGVVFFATLALAVVLDRRARRGQEVEALRRAFLGLVPVPWLLAALLFFNGHFDTAPPVGRSASVVGRFTMPGTLRSSRLVVTSWRPGRRIERVAVSRDDYHRFTRGDAVVVQMQEGLIGIPWVYSVHRK